MPIVIKLFNKFYYSSILNTAIITNSQYIKHIKNKKIFLLLLTIYQKIAYLFKLDIFKVFININTLTLVTHNHETNYNNNCILLRNIMEF